MNLYLLSQDHNGGYDTYDSCVVAAETEDNAKTIHPGLRDVVVGDSAEDFSTWAAIQHVQCQLIGTAIEGTERGVICASFNAG